MFALTFPFCCTVVLLVFLFTFVPPSQVIISPFQNTSVCYDGVLLFFFKTKKRKNIMKVYRLGNFLHFTTVNIITIQWINETQVGFNEPIAKKSKAGKSCTVRKWAGPIRSHMIYDLVKFRLGVCSTRFSLLFPFSTHWTDDGILKF